MKYLRTCSSQRSGSGLLETEKKDYKEEVVVSKVMIMIPCLHEDVITQILNRVPAESLYENLRYVCKPWFNIINNPFFRHNHPVSDEPPCLIIQNKNYNSCAYDVFPEVVRARRAQPHTTSFIQLREEGCQKQVEDFDSVFKRLWIRACCNGLLIVHPFESPTNILYLVNLVTKQNVRLPPACYYMGRTSDEFPTVGFIFIPSTGEYKVVLHRLASQGEILLEKPRYIQILTFGGGGCSASNYDDLEWRVVEAPRFSASATPIAVDEVVYWDISLPGRTITCLDVRDEKFYTIPCPGDESMRRTNKGLLEMAGHLACWVNLHRNQQLDFWILKNFRTGEWIKYASISIGQDIGKPIDEGRIRPVLSYESNGEIILMFINTEEGNLLAYNMKSSIWWKMGNKLKLSGDPICFYGFHVKKILPLNSLFEKKQVV